MQSTYKTEYEKRDGVLYKRCVFCGQWKLAYGDYAKNGLIKEGVAPNRLITIYNSLDYEAAPSFSHQEWKETIIFFGGECAYCGCTPHKGRSLTRDHLQPVSRGGKTIQSNIVPACESCNSSKGADDFKDWYMKQAFFSQERLNKIFKWRSMMRMVSPSEEA